MRVVLCLLLVCCCSFSLSAGEITGSVSDAVTKSPFAYVTVSLLQEPDGTLVKGNITDEKGRFTLSDVPKGRYRVRISFVGYNPVELPVELSNDGRRVVLKPVQLAEDTQVLQAVEVVGQRSQMRFEVDKRVFDVGQNVAAIGGSVSQVLETIPSVEVDTEGNISLRNNENVTIWINGRPAGLSEENRAQILEQMPAENIQSIEVITNPSAKFSPEGSAGIINLVLKKERKAGYYGSLSGGGNTRGGYDAGGNINYSSSRLDALLSIGTRGMRFKNSSLTERTSWPSDDPSDKTRLVQDNRGSRNGSGTFARAGLTYHPTAKDQIGLSAFGMLGSRNSRARLFSDENGERTRERISQTESPDKLGEIVLDYARSIRKGSDLRLSVTYNAMSRDYTSRFHQQNYAAGEPGPLFLQRQTDDSRNSGWEMQADYTNQLSETWKIETGYKGDLNTRISDVVTWEGENAGALVPNPDLANRFDYDENIQALYVTLSGKRKALSGQIGLRGEYMHFETKTRSNQALEPYSKEYFQLFPSFFLSYSLPNRNELQLNYTRRVNRPRGRQLNSFRNITDSTSISYGNPNLEPEFSNSLELNYIKTWDNHTLSASAYYRSTDGVIQRVSYFDAPAMYTTYRNISQSRNIGMELVGKNRFFSLLDLTTTLNLYYYKLNGFSYRNPAAFSATYYPASEDFSWDVRCVASVILPAGWTVQATGRYRSSQVQAQGERSDSYSLDMGIRKSFLSRKLTVALTGRDLLDSRRRDVTTWGDNFYQRASSHFMGRSVGVNVTYLFGSNNGRKKNSRQESRREGDDMEGFDF